MKGTGNIARGRAFLPVIDQCEAATCFSTSPFILSVLRIFAGLSLMQHGTAKWLGFPVAPQFANTSIASLSGVASLLELVVGALFVVGLFTRSAAFLLSGLLAAAYFIAHAPRGFQEKEKRWRDRWDRALAEDQGEGGNWKTEQMG